MSNEGPVNEEAISAVQAMTQAMQAQLAAIERLQNAFSSMQAASQGLNNSLQENTQNTNNNNNAVQEMTEQMQQATEGSGGLADALGRQASAATQAGNAAGSTSERLTGLAKNAAFVNTAFNAFGEAATGMQLGLGFVTDALSGALGLFQSGLGIVGGFFSGLFDAATSGGGGGASAMQEANNELIKSFGNLENAQAQTVKGMAAGLGPAKDALEAVGNSMIKPAEMLKEMTALATEFGESMVFLQDQMVDAADEMFIMQKAMNMTGESFKNLGSNAKAAGGSLEGSLQTIASASVGLAKTFDLDVKQIGKSIDMMAKDMKSFGHLSEVELTATAAYANKLGVAVSDLQGVMGAFDTFESAAQNAGKLAEAFGMNIDAMAMMNAENPAERIDMLRQSLQETGKSFDELSRHEKQLMAQTAGMDMSALQNAMSVDVDEMGFGDFEDAAAEAAEAVSPEEAMMEMSKSIEKLSKSMGGMSKSGGPLAQMMAGFKEVVNNSPEMKDLMNTIKKWLGEFFKLGKTIGGYFMGFIRGPGKKGLTMFKEIFNLDRIKEFTKLVGDAFKEFFELVATDPKAAVEGLFDKIMEALKKWFTGGPSGKGFADLFKTLIIGAFKILAGLAPKIIKLAADSIKKLAEGLRKGLSENKDMKGEMGDTITGAMMEAFDAIKEVIPDLLDALKDLFMVLFERFSPILGKIAMAFLGAIVGKAILTAIIQSLGIDMVSNTVGKFKDWIVGMFQTAEEEVAPPKSIEEQISEAMAGVKVAIEEGKELDPDDTKTAGKNLVFAAFFVGVALVEFAIAIKAVWFIVKDMDWPGLVKTFAVMAVSMLSITFMADVAKQLRQTDMVKGGIALVAAAFFVGVSLAIFAGAVWGITQIVKKIEWKDLAKTFAVIGVALLATWGLAYVGGVVISDGGVGFAMGFVGMVAAAVFLTIAVFVWAEAIKGMIVMCENIDWKGVVPLLAVIGIATLATLGLAYVGATMATVGLAAMALAAIGLYAASKFLTHSLTLFADALIEGLTKWKNVDIVQLLKVLAAVGLIITSLVAFMAIGLVFGVGNFWGIVGLMEDGLSVASEFAKTGFTYVTEIVQEINKIPISKPEEFRAKMEAIGVVIDSISKLSEIGLKAAGMAVVASLFSDKSPEEMMTEMSTFFKNVLTDIKDVIVAVVDLGKGIKPEELKGIEAVGNIIGAIAQLGGALIGPLQEAQKNVSVISMLKGDTASKQIGAMSAGVGTLLEELTEHLPLMITGLKDTLKEIDNPEEFAKKATGLKTVFEAIVAMVTAVEKLDALTKVEGLIWDSKDPKLLTDMFDMITDVMGTSMTEMLFGVEDMMKSVRFPSADKMELFSKGITTFIKVIEGVANLGKFMMKGGEKGLRGMKGAMTRLKKQEALPSGIIASIIEEANNIAEVMKDIELDPLEVNLKPKIESVLGYEGDRTFTIKPETVTIKMDLKVNIDAKELATAIYKGNKKNGKDGFFVLTDRAKAGGLEGNKGG